MGNQLFDELIGTPPRSNVDLEGIMRRERRSGAVRRLGGSLAAVLALAVAGGVVVGTGDQGPASAVPRAAPASSAADTRFRLVFDTREAADATAKRLSAEMDKAFRKEAPGGTWISDLDGSDRFRIFYKEQGDNPPILGGGSTFSVGGRKGRLLLNIFPMSSSSFSCERPDGSDDHDCETTKIPGGMTMKVEKIVWNKKTSEVSNDVAIQLPENRVLYLGTTNNIDGDYALPAQPEPALTMELVKAIATEVAGQVKA